MKKLLLLIGILFATNYYYSQTFYMCSGTNSTNSTAGNIYDSGGPSGTYFNNETCTFLIKSPSACGGTINLSFSLISTEQGYDYLTVYNGSTTTSPLLGSYSGNAFPPTLVANSGFMLIRFTSDNIVTTNGFAASWNTTPALCTPIANFIPGINSCQGSVYFSNSSQNSPTAYFWDFGDGNTSTVQNPTHTYNAAGNYTVELEASNINGTHSVKKMVSVNPLSFKMGYTNSVPLALSPVTFTTDYENALSYSWNFGTGAPTASTSLVQHTFMNLGTYSVTLNVTNPSCSTTRTLVLNITQTQDLNNLSASLTNLTLAPNPTQSNAQLKINSLKNSSIEITIYNELGVQIKDSEKVELNPGENELLIDGLKTGLNIIRISDSEGTRNLRIIKTEN